MTVPPYRVPIPPRSPESPLHVIPGLEALWECPGRIRACKGGWAARMARAAGPAAWPCAEPCLGMEGHRDAENRQRARAEARSRRQCAGRCKSKWRCRPLHAIPGNVKLGDVLQTRCQRPKGSYGTQRAPLRTGAAPCTSVDRAGWLGTRSLRVNLPPELVMDRLGHRLLGQHERGGLAAGRASAQGCALLNLLWYCLLRVQDGTVSRR